MPDFIKMGFILMIIGAIATAFLAMTSDATREPIAEARKQETLQKLSMILPKGFDNEPVADVVNLADKKLNRKETPVIFYRARKGEQPLAAAFVVTAPDGYSGNIEIMISVMAASDEITGVQVVAHKETPGLGDKITTTTWPEAFKGKTLGNAKWAVKKDGGEFDQFAGATITPRAIVKAVKAGMEYFVANKAKIFERSNP